jgi:hypothetical protein
MTCRVCREAGQLVTIPDHDVEVVTHGTETKIRTRCPQCGYLSDWFAAG